MQAADGAASYDGGDVPSSSAGADAVVSVVGDVDCTESMGDRKFREDFGWSLADYLEHFGEFGYEQVNLRRIVPFWSIDMLSVGSPLQPASAGDHFNFIAALYTEAKRRLSCVCEEGGREGSAEHTEVQAKALVLTAGLFEQCRLREAKVVVLFFKKRMT